MTYSISNMGQRTMLIFRWLRENFGEGNNGRWSYIDDPADQWNKYVIIIHKEEDATMFMLRWA
jgi:hypothetical protein